MAEAKPGNTALEEGIQTLPCDAELEKYFPVIKGNPVVGSRDGSSPCFTPQMIKYYAPNGVLPYKLDVARGEVVFALDNTRFDESMNAQDFRIQCSEIFRLMSPELRRLTADDKRIKLIYFDPNLLDRLTPYIVNPELIDVYRAQRKAEEDAIRGVISDKATEVFVNNLLNRAIQERASDIHFEACGGLEHRIRFRVDGKLRERRAEPRTVYPLLGVPSVAKRNESAAWSKRSGEVQDPEPFYSTKSYPTSLTSLIGSPVDL